MFLRGPCSSADLQVLTLKASVMAWDLGHRSEISSFLPKLFLVMVFITIEDKTQDRKHYKGRNIAVEWNRSKGWEGARITFMTGKIIALHTFHHQHHEVSHWTIIDYCILVISLECLVMKHKLTEIPILCVAIVRNNEFRFSSAICNTNGSLVPRQDKCPSLLSTTPPHQWYDSDLFLFFFKTIGFRNK